MKGLIAMSGTCVDANHSLRASGEAAGDRPDDPRPIASRPRLAETGPCLRAAQEICVIIRDLAAQRGYSHVYEAWTGDIDHALSFDFA